MEIILAIILVFVFFKLLSFGFDVVFGVIFWIIEFTIKNYIALIIIFVCLIYLIKGWFVQVTPLIKFEILRFFIINLLYSKNIMYSKDLIITLYVIFPEVHT